MKKKVILLTSGLLAIACLGSVVAYKTNKKVLADTTVTYASVTFGKDANALPTAIGSYTAVNSNGYDINYQLKDIQTGVTASWTDDGLVLVNDTDEENGFYSLGFEITGVSDASYKADKAINPTIVAYHYGSESFSGYLGSNKFDEITYDFSGSLDIPSKLHRLSVVFRAGAHETVTISSCNINYIVEYCNGTLN